MRPTVSVRIVSAAQSRGEVMQGSGIRLAVIALVHPETWYDTDRTTVLDVQKRRDINK